MQSRIGSIIESVANITVGFGVALASQMLIFPLYGVHRLNSPDRPACRLGPVQ